MESKHRKTKVNSIMAKRISSIILTPHNSSTVQPMELFLPRRMGFNYELDEETASTNTDVPTTVLRSKADCLEPKEMVSGYCDPDIISRVAKLYTYIRQGNNPAKRRKKQKKG